ncbi:MAG TPA: 5'-3' exonuclease H3TH domain-containing protein, partial [Sumerlaeia bacterium]|nr:5'-3' exonuclease H3TH domain-containing protein [Sumerlaeia bacterium]
MDPKNANAKGNLFLVDGLSLVFQAFYGVRGNLRNAEGMPTNAIFGFVKKILALFSAYEPTHLVVAFDSPGPTFRHGIYPLYKANREEAPEEFTVQVPYVFRVLEAMAVPTRSIEGYEADDIIGALARLAVERGLAATIVSADKDLFQLVDDRVSMLRSLRDDMSLYGPREVKEKMGVEPAQIVDYLALAGDASDNIPGVPRIGPKTAAVLLREFGSLDAILANPDQVPSKTQRALLLENADQARLSRRLAEIDRAAPVDFDLESTVFAPRLDSPSLLEIYRRLGFKSLIPDRAKQPGAAVPQPRPDYRVVWDRQSLEDVVRAVRRAGRVAVDTETTDIDTMRAKLVGLSLAWQPGAACYVPVAHGLEGDRRRQLPLETIRAAVGPLLADEEIEKIAQNAKFDMRVLERHDMPVRGLRFDTMLASYLLDPEGRHGLKSLA